MDTSSTPAAIARFVADALSLRKNIAAAYLLGSAVSGRLRDDSDIDIALLLFDGQSFLLKDRLDLAMELEMKFKRQVDIGIMNSSNLVYASEAILKGQRIFTVDSDYADVTETRFLGCYIQFIQDRSEVESAYYAA